MKLDFIFAASINTPYTSALYLSSLESRPTIFTRKKKYKPKEKIAISNEFPSLSQFKKGTIVKFSMQT